MPFSLTTTQLGMGIASLMPHRISNGLFSQMKMNQCLIGKRRNEDFLLLFLLFFFLVGPRFSCFCFLLSSLLWLFAVAIAIAIAVAHSWVNISKISGNCVSLPPFCGLS